MNTSGSVQSGTKASLVQAPIQLREPSDWLKTDRLVKQWQSEKRQYVGVVFKHEYVHKETNKPDKEGSDSDESVKAIEPKEAGSPRKKK